LSINVGNSFNYHHILTNPMVEGRSICQ
jgi:hypothetical protein